MGMEPSGGSWEPEWMRTLREIDENIARNVDRYIWARKTWLLWVFLSALYGYSVGFFTTELLKWWVGK